MRMLKRPDCSYEQFQEMRQLILDTAPYGLINDIYDDKNKIGYLYFWDSDYIPKIFEQWVVRPISTKSEEPGVSEEHQPSSPVRHAMYVSNAGDSGTVCGHPLGDFTGMDSGERRIHQQSDSLKDVNCPRCTHKLMEFLQKKGMKW